MNHAYVINTFSYIWTRTAQECIARLAGQGFHAFEILLTSPHLWPAECDRAARRRLAETLERHEARIVSLNAGGFDNNLASPAQGVRGFAQQYLRDTIDLAADLGGADVVIAPGQGRGLRPPPREWMLGWFRSGLDVVARHAETRGVRLLVENVPFSFLPQVDGIMAAIDGFPAERVGIVYDVANAVYAREDPVEGLRTALSRIGLLHLSDTPLDAWRHDPVGRGAVPFDRIAAALVELPCAAPLVLEIVSDTPEADIIGSARTLDGMGYRPR